MIANLTADCSTISIQKLMGSSDYCLDISHSSGPPFDLVYNGSFKFNLFNNTAETIPPAFDIGQTVFVPPSHLDYPSTTATVLPIPIHLSSSLHSIQITSSGNIMDVMECNLMPHDPQSTIDDIKITLTLLWIQQKAKTTLFIPGLMVTPKQGFFIKKNNCWSFHPGRTPQEKIYQEQSKLHSASKFCQNCQIATYQQTHDD